MINRNNKFNKKNPVYEGRVRTDSYIVSRFDGNI